jgi:hypothetical protein
MRFSSASTTAGRRQQSRRGTKAVPRITTPNLDKSEFPLVEKAVPCSTLPAGTSKN